MSPTQQHEQGPAGPSGLQPSAWSSWRLRSSEPSSISLQRHRRPRSAKVSRGDRGGTTTEADGALPDGVTVFDDEYPGVANLDPDLLQALREAATDAADDGIEFYVNSGGVPRSTRISFFVRRSRSTARKRKLPDGSPPRTRLLTCPGRGRHRVLRCHGVAVRTRRRVRTLPDLPQRAVALRTTPSGDRSWLPSHVCRPHAGSEDAAVDRILGRSRRPLSGCSPRRSCRTWRKIDRRRGPLGKRPNAGRLNRCHRRHRLSWTSPASTSGAGNGCRMGCTNKLRIECDVDAGRVTIYEARPPWQPDLGPEWIRSPSLSFGTPRRGGHGSCTGWTGISAGDSTGRCGRTTRRGTTRRDRT
jgi:hypothetical protein